MLHYVTDLVAGRATHGQLSWLYRNAPAGLVRGMALHRFRQTVRWAARRSPFYRRAFAERGIDARRVRTPGDLGDFFTTPDDIVRQPEDFLCGPPAIVFESSGTSGKNKQVYYGRDELDDMGRTMAAGLRMMGVGPEDRVANAFDFSIWIPGLITHNGLIAAGNFCLAFGKVDPVEVYRRLEQYRFTVVMGEPTWLIRLTELAERHGGYPLKILIGGAEEMPARAVPWMEKVWSGRREAGGENADMRAKVKMCYGSVELGSALGFQPCDRGDGYHLDDVDFLPEVVDADAEGYGEIVFSTLVRRTMPLIRYRTRDVSRLDAGPCGCGLRAARMERLRGRRDELVVASGGNLYPLMFENILRAVPGLSHDWQVVFKLEGVREILEVHVESARDDADALRAEVIARAAEQYPDLMKNLALGIFQMRVRVHPPGAVRRGRKLRRMVDQRHFQPAATPDDAPAEEALAAAP